MKLILNNTGLQPIQRESINKNIKVILLKFF